MTQVYSKGVQELITRLEEEGVNSGKKRADQLLHDAHQQAGLILDRAIKEAEQTVKQAQKQAEVELQAGKDALNLSLKSMLLDFRTVAIQEFQDELGRMVTHVLEKEETIEKLIMLIAKDSLQALGDYSENDLTLLMSESGSKDLDELTRGLAHKVIDHGVNFSGMKLSMKNDNVVVDFSDEAFKKAILNYLQPRFVALITGLNA